MTESEYWYNRYTQEIIQRENDSIFFIFSKVNARLFKDKDGDQWCVLYGENLQDGICGFGDTPYAAIVDFNKAWFRK